MILGGARNELASRHCSGRLVNSRAALFRVLAGNTIDLNSLKQALRRQPFKPFTLRLADGRSEMIRHPGFFVAVGPRIVVVIREDNSWLDVQPLLIVSLDFEGGTKKRGNGEARRKNRPSS